MGSFDLSQFRNVMGQEIYGILGMPFLKDYIVRIDFDRGTLTLLSSAPKPEGEEFTLSYDEYGRPLVDISVGSADPKPFLIDTGFIGVGASLSVVKRTFADLIDQGRIELHERRGRSLRADGTAWHREGWLDELHIGQTVLRRIVISESPENKIGMSLLSRYVVTFDFPKGRLYLQPQTRINDAGRLDLSGLSVWRVKGEVEVFEVYSGTPADAAGLEAGDRILQYDEKSVSSLRLFQLRTILATEGLRVKLDVNGPNGRRKVALNLTRRKSEAKSKTLAK